SLVGKQVFLMAEPENGLPSVYTGFASVLQTFTNNGGIVIMCGAGGTQANCLFNTGLINGTYFGTGTGGTMTVVQSSHPLADQVAATFTGPNATLLLDITNVDANQVVTSAGNDVVTYRNTGAGKVIYIGFDYFATSIDASRIIANAMEWAVTGIIPSWIDITSVSDTITAGDSATVNVTFNSFGLSGGTYYGQIIISTNDPLNPQIAVPCTLTVTNNVCPDFIYVANNCNGTVTFTDQTLNSPTSWAWQFGDGGTSTLANPTHTYSSIGTYSVTLVACNALGCDSITLSVFVPSVSGPIAASCTPVTTGYCCLMGITQVEFNTINNISANGSVGYENFTCTGNTNVIAGQTYLLKVTTGPTYMENVRAWIDYNNDGVFNIGTEQVFTSTALVNHQANVTIPLAATFNTPLRMRVGSDYSVNAPPAPCNNVQYGQFEDYTILVIPANAPPVALFNTQIINTCTGEVQFYDISQNLPTSWQWDFDDGNTSTLQNPTHQYLTAGTYQVELIATNAFGSDTIVNSVTVNTIVAQIQYSGIMQVGQPISFTCPTPNALTWFWDFGDGFFSSLQSPIHTYAATGNYTVTLTITGAGGCTVQTDTLISIITGIDEYGNTTEFYIAPNPFVDETTVHYTVLSQQNISIVIFDAKGTLVYKPVNDEKKVAGKYNVSCPNLSPGIYFVQLRAGEQTRVLRMVKLK
ncbi:MAG: PKD domain-containing protein, partial [Bacteroidia bacterium]